MELLEIPEETVRFLKDLMNVEEFKEIRFAQVEDGDEVYIIAWITWHDGSVSEGRGDGWSPISEAAGVAMTSERASVEP